MIQDSNQKENPIVMLPSFEGVGHIGRELRVSHDQRVLLMNRIKGAEIYDFEDKKYVTISSPKEGFVNWDLNFFSNEEYRISILLNSIPKPNQTEEACSYIQIYHLSLLADLGTLVTEIRLKMTEKDERANLLAVDKSGTQFAVITSSELKSKRLILFNFTNELLTKTDEIDLSHLKMSSCANMKFTKKLGENCSILTCFEGTVLSKIVSFEVRGGRLFGGRLKGSDCSGFVSVDDLNGVSVIVDRKGMMVKVFCKGFEV